MRLRAMMVFAALVAGSAAAQNVSKLDEMHGFLGVKLGSPISQFRDALVLQKGTVETLYRRSEQQLEFGGLKLAEVHYRVFGEQIVAITLTAASDKDNQLLFKVLEKAFGPTRVLEPNPGDKVATWEGNQILLSWANYPSQKLYTTEFLDKALDQKADAAAQAVSGQKSFR